MVTVLRPFMNNNYGLGRTKFTRKFRTTDRIRHITPRIMSGLFNTGRPNRRRPNVSTGTGHRQLTQVNLRELRRLLRDRNRFYSHLNVINPEDKRTHHRRMDVTGNFGFF